MSVLSKMLDEVAGNGDIGYHRKCKNIGLTHLCFADDLMVFADGTQHSIEGILKVFEAFDRMSGLRISMEKSVLFLAGHTPAKRNAIQSQFQFATGSLPVEIQIENEIKKRTSSDTFPSKPVKEMSHCDEKIESTNNSENEIQNAILPEVKEDKEPKNEKEPEEDKEKVVSGKTKESKSPGTPRRNVTKLMGAALLPFGRCLKPTTSDASQQKINGESAFANKGETEMVPLRLAVENDEPRSVEKARSSFVDKALTFACLVVPKSARPSSVEKPPSEEKAHPDVPVVVLPSLTDADEKARSNVPGVVLPSSTDTVSVTAEESEDIEPRLVPVVAELKDAVVVAELKDVVGKLTEAINNNFAKDPLESLYKERDELRQLVLAIGGLTTVASFSSPPGGLDSNGYIRFRHTSCHAAYLVLSDIGFVLTLFNLAQLHKPIEEQANKAKTLRTRLNIGWFFLWLAVALFFGTFTAGFWLVFPAKEPKGSVHKTSGHNIWPRWFILGTSIVKVFGSVVFVFGKMIWSKLVG